MRLRQSARTWWLSFSNEVKRTAMPATARLDAALREVDEVVVLDLAGRDHLARAVRHGEADAHRRAERQRIGELEEDAARRDVAGDAVDLAEQQRLDPDGEHLVEPQVRPLIAARLIGGVAVRGSLRKGNRG